MKALQSVNNVINFDRQNRYLAGKLYMTHCSLLIICVNFDKRTKDHRLPNFVAYRLYQTREASGGF